MVRRKTIQNADYSSGNLKPKKGHGIVNVGHKKVRVYQCDRCDNTFMMVGSTPIGMAFPRPIDWDWENNKPFTGTCPNHQRSLVND